MIRAHIEFIHDRFILDFWDDVVQSDEPQTFTITFLHLFIHGEPHFASLDGDVEYEEEGIEPPLTIEELVQETISRRWPVPFPHHLMRSAAKDAWERLL